MWWLMNLAHFDYLGLIRFVPQTPTEEPNPRAAKAPASSRSLTGRGVHPENASKRELAEELQLYLEGDPGEW